MANTDWSQVFGDSPGPDFGVDKSQAQTTDWSQVFGDKPGPIATSETLTAKDEYEKLVQAKSAKAEKLAEQGGIGTAAEVGVGQFPILGPILQNVGASVYAALPESMGFSTGDTYSKRREDMFAQMEAMKRAEQKVHPYVYGAAELGSALALPVGEIAGIGEAATGSKVLGMGLEGATYGGASALAEKAGSKPASEQPDTGSSALLGGELGLGLGAAGAAIAPVVEKFAPEWMSALGNKDDYQVSQLAKAYDKDVKAGNVNMSFDDWMAAHSNGQPVNLSDLGGSNVQKFVQKTFKNQPEMADQFRDALLGRSQDAGTRFSDFAQGLTDSDLNASQIIQDAKVEADRARREAYRAAYAEDNGAGTWNPQWSNWINLPEVKNAIIKTEEDLVRDSQYRAVDPSGRYPAVDQVKSPFTTIDTPDGGFKFVMSSPQAVNMKYVDFLQRNINDAIDSIPTGAQGGVKDSLINMRQKIISDVTTPGSNYYNPDFANAYKSTPLFRGQTDAFTYGTQLLSAAKNPLKSSSIMNETSMMTPAEKGFAVKGVMADMLQKATKPDGSLDTRKLQQYFTQGNTRAAMQNAFGAQKYADLKRFVDAESVMAEAFAKSRSLGKVTSTVPRDVSTILSYIMFDKYALAKVVADYGNKFMSDRYAKTMVQRLMSDDPAAVRSAYDDIINNKPVRGAFTNMLGRLVPPTAGVIAPQPAKPVSPVEDYVNSQMKSAGITRAAGGRVAFKKGGRIHKEDGGEADGGNDGSDSSSSDSGYSGGYGNYGSFGEASVSNYGGSNNYGGADTSGGPGSAPGGDGSRNGSEGMGAGTGNFGGTNSQTIRNDSNLGGSDAGFAARAGDTPGFNTGMYRGVGPGVGEPTNYVGGGGGYGEHPMPQNVSENGGSVFGGPNDQMSNLLSQVPGPDTMQKALDNAGTLGGWFAGLNSPQPGNPYSDISMAGSQQMINSINAGVPSDFGTLAGIESRYGSMQPAHPSTPTPGSAYGPESFANPMSPTSYNNAYNYVSNGTPDYQGVGVGSPVEAYNKQSSPAVSAVRADFNNAFANAAAQGAQTFEWTNPVTGQRGTYAVKTRATGGVVKRATGGRIPEVDKLYKQAKKLVDGSTKPMLNLDDDYIAKALRVAKGLV